MAHWAEKYVGKAYVPGVYDCAELAREVLKREFGKDIRVPSARDYSGKKGIAMFRAMSSQLGAEKANCAKPITTPYEGCAVLLKARGYSQHIGVYCVINKEPFVLHAADSKVNQVVLCRVRDLRARALAIEGYYAWI